MASHTDQLICVARDCSFVSPIVRRPRGILVLEMWTCTSCTAFLLWPNICVLTACLLHTGLAIPSTSSVVHTYRIAMTPDRLLGRGESVRTTIALIAPLGPLAAGALLTAASPRVTIGLFAGCGTVLAVWVTLSPAVRGAPSLDDLKAFVEDA